MAGEETIASARRFGQSPTQKLPPGLPTTDAMAFLSQLSMVQVPLDGILLPELLTKSSLLQALAQASGS